MILFDRGALIQVFQDTIKLCNGETLKKAVQKSISETAFYNEDDYPALPKKRFKRTEISMNKLRTLETAQNYKKKLPGAKIAVLNFASAINVGGGVAHGSKAQEESICRCSTLYPVLNTPNNVENFYNPHREQRYNYYSDRIIYTPDIVVMKSDTDLMPETLPEKNWITVDVITCAAPNLYYSLRYFSKDRKSKQIRPTDDELYKIHLKRGEHILTVAAHHGADIFIGGAFGCGAFNNNPNVVAAAYNELAAKFKGYFQKIIFAVYCPPKYDQNFIAFNKFFNERAK